MDIKEVVNDEAWQAIRKSMLGTWMEHAKENVSRLRKYLGDFSDPLKVRRVYNYLTGSGFRSGRITHPAITKLVNDIKEHRRKQFLSER